MQREIKFRAWNKNKKIMVYEDEDNSSDYLDGWMANDVQVLNQTLNSEWVLKKYEFMQYTGLHDKNGKEIYEGDRVYIIPEDEYGEIQWNDDMARFVVIYDDILTDFDNWCGKDLEVVGTIYD